VGHRAWILSLLLFVGRAGRAQDPSSTDQAPEPPSTAQETTEVNPVGSKLAGYVFDLFNMAGTEKSKQFRPLTQSERNQHYLASMVNPLSFVRVAASAGIDQAKDKPAEWEQGASGYGKRYANIFAQYSIQRTVTYGLASALHEDNRYFNSGRQAFWPRAGYALASGVLARRDDGTRRFSFSLVGGVAAGAFLARTWLPSSQSSAADAAISFGITMGTNIGFGAVKEFVPNMVRPLFKKGASKP